MSRLKRIFMLGYLPDTEIDRLYHALIDVSVVVAGFDQGERPYMRNGICSIVRTAPPFYGRPKEDLKIMLQALFESWDKYSGDAKYPVPCPGVCARYAYETTVFNNPDHMWDRLHPYGANRRELLTHCINEVSKLRLEIQNGLKPYPINR